MIVSPEIFQLVQIHIINCWLKHVLLYLLKRKKELKWGMECLITRFLGFLCKACYVWDTPEAKKVGYSRNNILFWTDRSTEQETVQCWVYFLKNFRPELLSKPLLENYSSYGDHGMRYLERSKRDPNDNYYPEVKR